MTHDVEYLSPNTERTMEETGFRKMSMYEVPGFEWKLLRKLQEHGHLTDYQLICQSNGSEDEYHLMPSDSLSQ